MLEAVAHLDNLHAAWRVVRAGQGAPGVDGETVGDFAIGLEARLRELRAALLSGRYRPAPLRGVWLPKKHGGWRAVGVPCVRDRVAQRAALQVLYPRFEPQLETCSYAYRPGRSIWDALRQIERWRDGGHKVLLEADVHQCFDSIDRDRLRAVLHVRLDDAPLLRLLEQWQEAGVRWGKRVIVAPRGLAQGDLLSPLWCNVFLDAFDEVLLARRFKLVRYADDFVIVATRAARVREAREVAAAALGALELQLHPEKTRFASFAEGFEYLGARFQGDLMLPLQRRTITELDGDEATIFVPGYPNAPRSMPRPKASVPPAPVGGVEAASQIAGEVARRAARVGAEARLGSALAHAFERALEDKRRRAREAHERAEQRAAEAAPGKVFVV